ncbi:MAG: outer membrane lipid asymmetry maintenance protein MlaD [Lentisphaeria bacterium]
MKKQPIEIAVGFFMVLGIVCLGYLSVRLGDVDLFGAEQYEVTASFSDIGGLKDGAPVVIAGVQVGEVTAIRLKDYEGAVTMNVARDVALYRDAIATVKTRGLIGEKYISLSPGGAPEKIKNGGEIRETQPAVDLEQLISEFVFDKV